MEAIFKKKFEKKVFGTHRPTEERTQTKRTMEMGNGTRNGFQPNKRNANRRSLSRTLCKRQR